MNVVLMFDLYGSFFAQGTDGTWLFTIHEYGNFILSLGVNLLCIALFASRVYAPSFTPVTGLGLHLTAIPAVGYSVYQISTGGSVMQIVPPLLWTGFVVFDLIVNSVMRIEFRNPTDWRILAPFLAVFYGSTGSLWASTWENGLTPYLITTVSFVLMAIGSIIVRINEVQPKE